MLDDLTAGSPLDAGSIIVDAACYDPAQSLALCQRLACRFLGRGPQGGCEATNDSKEDVDGPGVGGYPATAE